MRCARVFAGVWLAAGAAGSTYTITTVAGGTEAGDGGPATAAQLAAPDGLAVDRAGNLYVADSLDHRVRKITPAGIISTLAGNGHGGFRGDGGPPALAQLNSPYGLAVDRLGNVYIADLGNARVRMVSLDGVIRTVAGGGLAPVDSGDATAARLNQPRNVAVDAAGNLFISDFADHRVYKVSPSGLISRVAGTGAPGSIKDNETPAALFAPLRAPAGLAVDGAGTLYVVDSGNSKVRRIRSGLMSTVASVGRVLTLPVGIAIDSEGQVVVADSLARVVVRLGPALAAVVAGSLNQPRDVVFDAAGNLYVADCQPMPRYAAGTVRKVDASGVVTAFAGNGAYRPAGDGGLATAAHLESPWGLAVDPAGSLYVADRLNYRVRKVSGGLISTVAGNGLAGWAGDAAPAATVRLDQPAGLALDARQHLWISEAAGHRVRDLSASGVIIRVAGQAREPQPGYSGDGSPALLGTLNTPQALAAGPAAVVYVADTANHVVRAISLTSQILSTVAGKTVPGYGGDGGPAKHALLNMPGGIAADARGNLYIADTGNHAIRMVTPAGVISTIAGTGRPGYGGDGGPAAAAHLSSPSGIAVDSARNLYLADTGNHRVRKVTPEGIIETIAGSGAAGYFGDEGPATAAELNQPVALAIDAAGAVFVSDFGNNRVRKLEPSRTPVEVARLEVSTMLNAASLLPGAVAPGEIVTLFGLGLGPGIGSEPVVDAEGALPTELVGTQVLFDGNPAPLLYVQFSQIDLEVPYEVAGRTSSQVEIRRDDGTSIRMIVPIVASTPGIFTVGAGTGPASAMNEDGTWNSAAYPAPRGTIVTLWATGAGQTGPPSVSGRFPAPPYPAPLGKVALTIGGEPATLLFAGAAPGCVGLIQINARVPATIAEGDQPVVLTVGGIESRPGVTVAVR